MKVESKDKGFKPFAIEITFESIKEAEEFYTVFNYSAITDALEYVDQQAIRDNIFGKDYDYNTLSKVFKKFTKKVKDHTERYG